MKSFLSFVASVVVATIALVIFLPLAPPTVHGAGGYAMLNAAGGIMPWATASALTTFPNTSQLHEKGPRWSLTSNPATGSKATVSKAAGGGTVRHVADCLQFDATSVTAPALSFLTVALYDGASGTTVLEQFSLTITAAAIQNVAPFQVCGLSIPGSANTAMTWEFSAGVTNVAENVTLTGYDVQ
jgi:hypothetical protein